MWRRLIVLVCLALVLGAARSAMADMIGYWPLDEGMGGQAVDNTGKGHNGTINGATWVTPGWDGQGACLQFDGVSARVEVPHANDLRFAANAKYTLAAWVNWTNRPGHWSGVVTKGREVGNWYGIWIDPSNQWVFGHGGNNQTGSAIVPNVWTHVAMVYDNGTKRIYLNGKLDNETVSSQSGDNTGDLWFGAAKGVTEFAPARIDDIRIYDQALTAQEVKALVPPKLKAYDPIPANGALGVAMPLLQWTAGEGAMFHNVYLGTSPNLTETNLVASRLLVAITIYYHVAGLTPGATYFWRVDEIEKDGVTVHAGDVWTLTMQDLVAYHPSPADKANEASPAPTLTWMPGQAATKHHVYFSDSLDAVTQRAADADKGTSALGDTAFVPGALESLKTYYWCVDETVGSNTKAGQVWSFSTFLSIDDFESYTDTEGSRIYETWIDGWTNGTGSQVGNTSAPFAEQGIVHGGLQSMPLDYNNVKTPFYSEAVQDFASAADWTIDSADTLVLYVRGAPGNKPASLYVAIEDTSKRSAIVTYPDTAITAASKWAQWKIPLSSFTGVNLAKIKKLYVGVGDKKAPVAGGAGRIYIDDIRAIKTLTGDPSQMMMQP